MRRQMRHTSFNIRTMAEATAGRGGQQAKSRHGNQAKSRRKPLLALPAALITLIFVSACSSIDCPLNSLVYTQYQLMDGTGKVDTLKDTLTVSTNRTDGSDSVLINRNVNTTELSLPISYSAGQDVFFFELKDTLTKTSVYDTVAVAKTNEPHFESVDCAPSFFHTITAISHTRHRIDSIVINNPEVNYDTSKKHFLIYFSKQ